MKQNDPNPFWTKQFVINYVFKEKQSIIVRVFDKDEEGNQDDFLVEVKFCVADVLMAKNSLTQSVKDSTLTMKAEVMHETNNCILCNVSGHGLANKDGWFGTSDPFLVISRVRDDGSLLQVFQNPPVMNNLSPIWPTFSINMQTLCNDDPTRQLKIEIYDYDSDGKHDYMGSVFTTVNDILASVGKSIDVIEEEKKKKSSKYVNSGTIKFDRAEIEYNHSFLTYLMHGCEISLAVAIDFTGSNGAIESPKSLHYLDPQGEHMNQYQKVITSVGAILESYDTDKMFPVLGFGAQFKQPTGTFPAFGAVNHCFPLAPDGFEVHGIAGVMNAYYNVLPHIKFSGPTYFAPLLNATLSRLSNPQFRCSQESQKYTVLLIVTDGEILDFPETKDLLVQASSFPMSIVIVGVGNANFSGMM